MHQRALVLLVLLSFAAGCTTNPATGDSAFTAFMSPEQERRIGAEEHPKLVREMGGAYADGALAGYVAEVGRRVAAVSEAAALPYTFTIIDSDDINAFALPGGYVHVTRGLLALASTEAELAGVLAHEIGHIVARHSAERYSRSVAIRLGGVILGALGSVAGLPADAGALIDAGGQAYLQSYSREQELEADMLGVRYLARAGYDPRAMAAFLEGLDAYGRVMASLAGQPETGSPVDVMASHPRTGDRVEQAMRLAATEAVGEVRVGRDAYLGHIDGLVFGDSPAQGLRLGRDFYHPRLGITFRVPPGFAMLNQPDQVVARGPQGSLIVFAMARSSTGGVGAPGPAADPMAYVRGWGARLGLRDLQRIEVNGMPGATGAARVRTGSGSADVRLVAIRAAPQRLYRFIFLTPPALTERLATELRRTTFSFRRLSETEAATVRPLRVEVVTVEAGDTVRSLAARLPVAGAKEALFRVLNGLEPGEPLTPGRKVKVVSGEVPATES